VTETQTCDLMRDRTLEVIYGPTRIEHDEPPIDIRREGLRRKIEASRVSTDSRKEAAVERELASNGVRRLSKRRELSPPPHGRV
jgi:hypothetical protein